MALEILINNTACDKIYVNQIYKTLGHPFQVPGIIKIRSVVKCLKCNVYTCPNVCDPHKYDVRDKFLSPSKVYYVYLATDGDILNREECCRCIEVFYREPATCILI